MTAGCRTDCRQFLTFSCVNCCVANVHPASPAEIGNGLAFVRLARQAGLCVAAAGAQAAPAPLSDGTGGGGGGTDRSSAAGSRAPSSGLQARNQTC